MPRAGLAPDSVTEAGAALADEVGLEQLGMGPLAERLGVRPPSLYKHVDSLADLGRRIALLATTELGEAIGTATQGRAGRAALAAAAGAMRAYVKEHPGRYAAVNRGYTAAVNDPLDVARGRLLDAFAAVLRGYRLDDGRDVHALRMLRSMLHGFVTLEVGGAFQLDTEADDSFAWLIDFVDRGLHGGAD